MIEWLTESWWGGWTLGVLYGLGLGSVLTPRRKL